MLLPDPDGTVLGALDPERVASLAAALCDRRAGLGADGVLRAVRTDATDDPAAVDARGEADWFMDYRNADGSLSEMCGNGVRVFGRYLVEHEGVDPSRPLPVATRGGTKVLTFDGDTVSVDMGEVEVRGETKVAVGGRSWPALHVSVGNPHAVAFVDSLDDAGALLNPPEHDAGEYPQGVNVEFVVRRGGRHVAMRVHERGSGETRSCGTGACAVMVARGAGRRRGPRRPGRHDVPGGRAGRPARRHLDPAAAGGADRPRGDRGPRRGRPRRPRRETRSIAPGDRGLLTRRGPGIPPGARTLTTVDMTNAHEHDLAHDPAHDAVDRITPIDEHDDITLDDALAATDDWDAGDDGESGYADEADPEESGGDYDLAERHALRRVAGLSTELEDITEVEYRQLRLERVVLVGVWTDGSVADAENSMAELALLAETAGSTVLDAFYQRRQSPDPATFIGRGKVDGLREIVQSTGADTVILDGELAPSQLRNLEDRVKVKVVDRTALILDIFAQHAKSREGQAQVELAQLNYMKQRLRGWGGNLSRQAGGRVGSQGGGIGGRGPGETKIETDRRRINTKIAKLRRELAHMRTTRDTKRSERKRHQVPSVAIAGYTNAGKSSLLNRLTKAGVLVEDSLFATLDPTTRRTETQDGRVYTVSDTVGFVRHLPHQLVEAFRSTLEEVADSDLVLHVVDGSHADPEGQLAAVREVFAEIGADKVPELVVINKADAADPMVLARLQAARAALRGGLRQDRRGHRGGAARRRGRPAPARGVVRGAAALRARRPAQQDPRQRRGRVARAHRRRVAGAGPGARRPGRRAGAVPGRGVATAGCG